MTFRRLLVAALMVIALVPMVGYVVWRQWLSNPANPGPLIDYDARFTALISSVQPQGEDAFPRYVAILEDRLGGQRAQRVDPNGYAEWYYDGGEDLRALMDSDLSLALRGPWGDEQSADARATAARLRPLLMDAIDQAAALPRCERPALPPAGATRFWYEVGSEYDPERAALRRFAVLNLIWMREAAAIGDWDEVERRAQTSLRLGRHLLSWPVILEWITGVSSFSWAIGELGTLALEHDIPAEAGESLIALIDSTPWEVAPQSYYLDAAELELLGLSQDWYSGALTGGATIVWPLQPRQGAVERKLIEYFDALRAWRSAPGPARASYPIPELDLPSRDIGVAMQAPAMGRPLRMFDEMETGVAQTRLMLRLEAFHAREGHWPDTLEEAASAAEIAEPLTGQAFTYRVLQADPLGRPFLLIRPLAAQHVRDDKNALQQIINSGGEAPPGLVDMLRPELPDVAPEFGRRSRP